MTTALPVLAAASSPLSVLNADTLLHALGPYVLLGLCGIVFAECGLLLGFFLPGDSLLFTAGLFAAKGWLGAPLWLACVALTVCAFLGNVVGYGLGFRAGPALFSKPDSKLFRREYVERTHAFFDKHGARAIVLARFVPIVRTFITAMAGVGRMDPRKYFTYSFVGGAAWASGVTVLGYFLGQIEFVHKNIELILVAIVFVSLIPVVVEFLRARREGKDAAASALEATQRMDRID